MEKSSTKKSGRNGKIKFAIGSMGTLLLLVEWSVAFDYMVSGLQRIQPELFSWWPTFSMMAWAMVEKIAWHPSGIVATAQWMPLSAVPFGLIAAGLLLGRREQL
jgi:hypothetical protein